MCQIISDQLSDSIRGVNCYIGVRDCTIQSAQVKRTPADSINIYIYYLKIESISQRHYQIHFFILAYVMSSAHAR